MTDQHQDIPMGPSEVEMDQREFLQHIDPANGFMPVPIIGKDQKSISVRWMPVAEYRARLEARQLVVLGLHMEFPPLPDNSDAATEVATNSDAAAEDSTGSDAATEVPVSSAAATEVPASSVAAETNQATSGEQTNTAGATEPEHSSEETDTSTRTMIGTAGGHAGETEDADTAAADQPTPFPEYTEGEGDGRASQQGEEEDSNMADETSPLPVAAPRGYAKMNPFASNSPPLAWSHERPVPYLIFCVGCPEAVKVTFKDIPVIPFVQLARDVLPRAQASQIPSPCTRDQLVPTVCAQCRLTGPKDPQNHPYLGRFGPPTHMSMGTITEMQFVFGGCGEEAVVRSRSGQGVDLKTIEEASKLVAALNKRRSKIIGIYHFYISGKWRGRLVPYQSEEEMEFGNWAGGLVKWLVPSGRPTVW